MRLALALTLVVLVAAASLMASPAYAQVQPTENGGPDILLITLITVAVFGGAAVLTSLLYLVRRSIGFEPHRPPEDDESGGEEH